jgi:hypothetical protein
MDNLDFVFAFDKVFARLPKDVVPVIFKYLPLRMAALYLPYCRSGSGGNSGGSSGGDNTAGRFDCPGRLRWFVGNYPDDGTDLIEWPSNLGPFEWLDAYKLILEGRSVKILTPLEYESDFPERRTVRFLDLGPPPAIACVGPLCHVSKLDLAWWKVECISAFSGIPTLVLRGCEIYNFSGLKDVQALDLSCTEIFDKNLEDLISLGSVHMLDLSECPNIIDPEPLSRISIHTLNLSGCKMLSDVGGLGGVHTLDLSDCQNVYDFSALGRVHTLNLSGTLVKNKDLEALLGVKDLILYRCRYIFDYWRRLG